jgi:molybdopterin synthase sulfur carrier subunit
MSVTVRIPTVLRNLTDEKDRVEVEADSIDDLIAKLDAAYPGIKERLCDDSGKLRRFVNNFVGDGDIRFLDGQSTELKDGETVDIVPAIAGGR